MIFREDRFDQTQSAAILTAMKWFNENRPDLIPHLMAGSTSATEKEGKYFVQFAIRAKSEYEYFNFWVNPMDESVEKVD